MRPINKGRIEALAMRGPEFVFVLFGRLFFRRSQIISASRLYLVKLVKLVKLDKILDKIDKIFVNLDKMLGTCERSRILK